MGRRRDGKRAAPGDGRLRVYMKSVKVLRYMPMAAAASTTAISTFLREVTECSILATGRLPVSARPGTWGLCRGDRATVIMPQCKMDRYHERVLGQNQWGRACDANECQFHDKGLCMRFRSCYGRLRFGSTGPNGAPDALADSRGLPAHVTISAMSSRALRGCVKVEKECLWVS